MGVRPDGWATTRERTSLHAIKNAPVRGFNVAPELTLTASVSAMSSRATSVFVPVPLDSNPNPSPARHYGIGRLWRRQARLAIVPGAKAIGLSQAHPLRECLMPFGFSFGFDARPRLKAVGFL